ncbi:ATP-binding protein [Variovorax sp. 770b2]|uniref:ATP-binding protein n=1 Tax=Variovorax sp. 770b2 TaxID=1566271 RepID=UPI003526D76E
MNALNDSTPKTSARKPVTIHSHGLGLEFVRTVVARHGGTIDGHAAPGAGATFCISLPRAR